MPNKSIAIIVTALLAVPEAAMPALIQIGAAGGVSGRVSALAPEAGAVGRILSSGKTVYHKDKVSTGPKARTQLMLKDETVFTIGPDSEMSLDEFVYDPFTDTGKVTAKVTKGVFRFVTGKVARKKPSSMKVKLPSGTIGIRGTMVAGAIINGVALVALMGPGANNNTGEPPGAAVVENVGVSVPLTTPGFGSRILGPGQPPTPAFQLTPQDMSLLSTAPPPEPGGQGGPGGGQSATQGSGQAVANTAGTVGNTESTGILAQDAAQNIIDAAEDIIGGVADGIAKWTDLDTITSGYGYYPLSGSFTCSGSTCGGSGSGTVSGSMSICFETRTIGTGSLSLSGSISPSTNIGDSGGALPIPFPSSGDAVITLDASNVSNSSFIGTTLTLMNDSSKTGSTGIGAAQTMDVGIVYNDGSDIAAGTATGDYVASF